MVTLLELFIGRMDELGSLIPSKTGEKTKEPYFGTYHHSTSAASKKIRKAIRVLINNQPILILVKTAVRSTRTQKS